MAPEDEVKDAPRMIKGHGLGAAAAAVAALASPPAEPKADPQVDALNQQLAELTADRNRVYAMHLKNVERLTEISLERDRWQARANKIGSAEAGLALERASKERDGLRLEVSTLSKRILESDKVTEAERKQLTAALREATAAASEQATRADRIQTTMEQAIKARDRAQAERDEVTADRLTVVKRVSDLEEQIKKLKDDKKPQAPRPGAGD